MTEQAKRSHKLKIHCRHDQFHTSVSVLQCDILYILHGCSKISTTIKIRI